MIGGVKRVGQWGSVELAQNEFTEGNDPRGFIKVRNF
jgi:hypothetical protein